MTKSKNIGYFKLCKVILEKNHKIIYNIKSENKTDRSCLS